MSEAVESFIEKKFGNNGTFRNKTILIKKKHLPITQTHLARKKIECVKEIAEYIYQKFSKFPGTVPSIFI